MSTYPKNVMAIVEKDLRPKGIHICFGQTYTAIEKIECDCGASGLVLGEDDKQLPERAVCICQHCRKRVPAKGNAYPSKWFIDIESQVIEEELVESGELELVEV